MMVKAVGQQLVHQLVDIAVMRMGDVDGKIPGETLFIDKGRGEAPEIRGAVDHEKILVTQLPEPMSRTQAGRPSTYDDDTHAEKISTR